LTICKQQLAVKYFEEESEDKDFDKTLVLTRVSKPVPYRYRGGDNNSVPVGKFRHTIQQLHLAAAYI